MTTKLTWQLIALMFALLILGIFIMVDVQKVVGLVLMGIAVVIGTAVRLQRDNQRYQR